MTKRSPERLQALSYILQDGLMYEWFRCYHLDEDTCTAAIEADTGDIDYITGNPVWKRVEIGPGDVARGLRMFREYAYGDRELYHGEWEMKRRRDPEYQPAPGPKSWYGWQLVEFDRTNGDEGDYDAITADMVMQFAIFGQVIYG